MRAQEVGEPHERRLEATDKARGEPVAAEKYAVVAATSG